MGPPAAGGPDGHGQTYAELKFYAESTTAYVIMVQGTISNGANGGQISVKSNKSIVGVGSTAFLNGVGIDINKPTTSSSRTCASR